MYYWTHQTPFSELERFEDSTSTITMGGVFSTTTPNFLFIYVS